MAVEGKVATAIPSPSADTGAEITPPRCGPRTACSTAAPSSPGRPGCDRRWVFEPRAPAGVAETVDAAYQAAEHQRAQDRAPQVEAVAARLGVRQQAHRQHQGDDADRHIDREQPRPRGDPED